MMIGLEVMKPSIIIRKLQGKNNYKTSMEFLNSKTTTVTFSKSLLNSQPFYKKNTVLFTVTMKMKMENERTQTGLIKLSHQANH